MVARKSECLYIGWGLKHQPPNFSPVQLPKVQDEYIIGPEVMEMADPTFADEEVGDLVLLLNLHGGFITIIIGSVNSKIQLRRALCLSHKVGFIKINQYLLRRPNKTTTPCFFCNNAAYIRGQK